MKNTLLTSLAFLLSFNVALASGKDFKINELKLVEAFAELDAIDASIESSGLSFEQVALEHSLAVNALEASPLAPNFGFDDMDWGAFAWGFCCSPVGFFVVAINSNKDNDQKASFWIGFVVILVLAAAGIASTPSSAFFGIN